ncbi:MAG: 5-bromo-4-chloroindolyl phosphate hydrolysis family protein, partial [Oscillospiraceae bacterium]|nr:5-bromo-4-chloroindolyl phosphate hydrolysis family protein [Oscillospiraceae bacterium]
MKKTERKNKPVSPIYAVAVVWIVCSAVAPIYTVGRFFFTALLSFVVYCAVRVLATKRQQERDRKQAEAASTQAKTERETKPKQAEPPKPKYPPEVQAVVDEGERAHGELERLYASIPDLAIKRKVREIIDVSDKIVADAVTDPSDVPQIKKFLDYYLPTTIKLLNAYDR